MHADTSAKKWTEKLAAQCQGLGKSMQWLTDTLFPLRADEEIVRSLTDEVLGALVFPTALPLTRPWCTTLLPFRDALVRATIHEAKYHGSEKAFTLLSSVAETYLRAKLPADRMVQLVPIPLGTLRRRARGYNQVEEIARRVGEKLDLPVAQTLLVRSRETPSQVSLPREKRAENMRRAFRVQEPVNPSHLYIVLDDVTTTGATLQAALDALTDAGATRLLPLALAH